MRFAFPLVVCLSAVVGASSGASAETGITSFLKGSLLPRKTVDAGPKDIRPKDQKSVVTRPLSPGKIVRKKPGLSTPARLRGKIGQMIMVGFRGTSPSHAGVQRVMGQLRNGTIGGVILMRHNVRSLAQLRRLTGALRKAARAGGQLPPLISIDQEGGRVQRLKITRFPTAKRVAATSPANAARVYARLACQVRAAGINVNFGPVVDLDIRGRSNPIIGRYGRSFSKSPGKVTDYARQFVRAHKRYGIATSAKHFPGHGSSLTDSHKGFTAVPGWTRTELQPYKALAHGRNAVDMVMVGHLYNRKWGAPASLSYTAITGMLRGPGVGFRGVVITDDMEMGAIRRNYSWAGALIRAVRAGNDIVLYTNTANHRADLGARINRTIAARVCAAKGQKGCISPAVINRAYQRIRALKTSRSLSANWRARRGCGVANRSAFLKAGEN